MTVDEIREAAYEKAQAKNMLADVFRGMVAVRKGK